MERALTRRQTAEALGISLHTLRRLVESGALPPPRQITRGRVGHLESEITDYLRSRPAEPLRAWTAAARAHNEAA